MTVSGPPHDDDADLEPEPIWDQPAEAAPMQPWPQGGASRGLAQGITSTDHVRGPAGLVLADVPSRIMALVIDIILLAVVGLVLAGLFGGLVSEPGALDSAGGELDVVAFLVLLLLQLAISAGYFIGSWVLLTATAGMFLLGLRVGDEHAGRSLDLRRAGVRWLIIGVPSLLVTLPFYVTNTIALILAGFGLVWLLLLLYGVAQSPTKQGWHDRLARSIVVRARRRGA